MDAQVEARQREFAFSEADFQFIREMVREHIGIKIPPAKKDMVYSRLVRRLRQLKLESFDSYCQLLRQSPGEELVEFTNALTTNLTSFFREGHHFAYLAESVIPELMRRNAAQRRLRIWSAGCSTGEEPYSIAMVLRESMPEIDRWDVRVLATDLDSNVIETGKQGIYREERISALPARRRQRWFLRGRGERQGLVRVRPEVRELVHFRQLNLLREWPMRGLFDVIFCRNVVIYFDKPTQSRLFARFAEHMPEESHLFVGHSESLFKVTDKFRLLGNTVYRRVG